MGAEPKASPPLPPTFVVIFWVVGSVALGVAILLCAPAARAKGVPWCIGCSVEKLLPIIELSREFGDFLNDPNRERLRGWQIAFFSGFALWGWVLGLFAGGRDVRSDTDFIAHR